MTTNRRPLRKAVVRFCGDSGDGMQLTGSQFTDTAAQLGNDLSTLPDYPAEIRAPAGTLFGVSGFQLQFAAEDIRTPGDQPDVLMAMNPAALKTNLADLKPGGLLIVNEDAFTQRNLEKAGYDSNPLDAEVLIDMYRLHRCPLSKMATQIGKEAGLGRREADRCKNFIALGIAYWLFDRPMAMTEAWVREKFATKPDVVTANLRALSAGWNYGETVELFDEAYSVAKVSDAAPGVYRNISGNQALALGMVAASVKSGRDLVLGSYPITPASDILHELSRMKHMGVRTVQAEDEIAGACIALGASYGGGLGITSSSGPGIALKSETIGLALTVELPMIIINVQRGGPSTGLPTKTEQSDLLQMLYGRNGDSPLPVVAAKSPGDCFYAAFEAVRIALRYNTPVILLSDGYLANSSEPIMVPRADELPELDSPKWEGSSADYLPYARNVDGARFAVAAGTPGGFEHRIGGLEKADQTGHISYDPENHELMTRLRAQKVQNVADDLPPTEIEGAASGDLLVLGWGGTWGAISTAVLQLQKEGASVSSVHLRHLCPLPNDLGAILKNFTTVVVPELNNGQLIRVIRDAYLVDAKGINQIQGKPFTEVGLATALRPFLKGPS
jgi:2-oxoglutarate ferredoxin oxidoreductase subunit alpha